MAVDGEGDVYVVDWMNERVVIFNAEGLTMATLRGEAHDIKFIEEQYARCCARIIEDAPQPRRGLTEKTSDYGIIPNYEEWDRKCFGYSFCQ